MTSVEVWPIKKCVEVWPIKMLEISQHVHEVLFFLFYSVWSNEVSQCFPCSFDLSKVLKLLQIFRIKAGPLQYAVTRDQSLY